VARAGIRVEVDSPEPQLRAAAEAFFGERVAADASPAALDRAIREFCESRGISHVQVVREASPDGEVYRFSVRGDPILSRIAVSGADAVGDDEIVTWVGVTAGVALTDERLQSASARIAEQYRLRGFPEAKVGVRAVPTDDPRRVELRIRVEEGPPCRLSRVGIRADRPVLSDKELRNLLGVRVGDRCDAEAIAEGAGRIRERLREEGFLASDMADPVLEASADRRTAELSASVTVGPRIEVVFRGNTLFFERDAVLAKVVRLETERQFSRVWMESTAVGGIRTFYRAFGYPDAKVEAIDRADERGPSRTIEFRIDRGPKVYAGEVSFDGANRIGQEELRKVFWKAATGELRNGAFVLDEYPLAARSVIGLYQSRGFLRARLGEPKVRIDPRRNVATVAYDVEEGEPSVLGEYRLRGNTVFDSATLKRRFGIRPGEAIDPVRLGKAAEGLEDAYRSKGYKFVRVAIPRVEEIPSGPVTYDIAIEEGPQVRMGEVLLRGNLVTHDEVILREVRIGKGDLYDPDKLRETRRRIVRLGFFRQVSLEEVNYDPASGREDLLITVEERKQRVVRIRPGFSTDDGARLAGDFLYQNIAGTGRTAGLRGQVSRKVENAEVTEHLAVVSYREPAILNLVSGRVHYIDERAQETSFNIDRRGFVVGFDREAAAWLRASLQYEIEYRNPFDVKIDPALLSPFDEQAALFAAVGTIWDLDFRDDLLNPQKGTLHRVRFDVYDDTLGSEASFWQVTLRNSFYLPIQGRFRLVTALRFGFSSTFGQTAQSGADQVPIEKRFRLGGADSLRGFNRNCVGGIGPGLPEDCSDTSLEEAPGGNAMFNYMVDLLIPLFGGIDLALFTDGGNAYPLNGDFDILDIRTSAGVGIRYNTFFGPLRFDVGFKLDRREDENLAEVHFSVGQF
jgi:outer membrane protein insertion porin family